MSDELRWITTQPTESGWYWHKDGDEISVIWFDSTDKKSTTKYILWSGPIQAPKDRGPIVSDDWLKENIFMIEEGGRLVRELHGGRKLFYCPKSTGDSLWFYHDNHRDEVEIPFRTPEDVLSFCAMIGDAE